MRQVVPPDEHTLRAFLLGTLPGERVALVEAWLDADPLAVERLRPLSVDDDFVAALTEAARRRESFSPAVDRLVSAATSMETTLSFVGAQGETHSGGRPCGRAAQATPASRAPLPDWAPAELGGYRLIRELGHGGMGYVFEAEDERIQRRVAIKVLHPDKLKRDDAGPRFLREARAAAAVEHENVARVLHVGEDAGMPFMVMPLLKGATLQKRLKKEGTLPAADVLGIGADVAAALAAAHDKGLIHRDLKPDNVWLEDTSGRALVLDFGLARLRDGADVLTESGAVVGTPAYMAPEQIDGQPPDPKVDLFALGATLYECATGRRAFDGPTITAVLKAVAEHHPPAPAEINPKLPAALSELIQRLLAKNPAHRPSSAGAVQAMLEAIADRPTVTWQGKRAQRPRFSGHLLVALGVIALTALGILLVVRPWGPSESAGPKKPAGPPPVRYRGKIDVLVERVDQGKAQLLRLQEPGALPLKASDKFRIEGEVDPPAYVYVVWVDPDRDVTPVYPWDARTGWGSRPADEQPVERVSLPRNVGNRYTAPKAKPGVATIVLLARATPLEAPDDVVKTWFESLPDLPLPAGGDGAAVWFDNFIEVRDPLRLRTFGEVGADDVFARWQGELQRALGGQVGFQTAVSFARTGAK